MNDFTPIPGGGIVQPWELERARRVAVADGFRCHRSIGEDIQSGNVYCGEPAAYEAWNKDRSGRWIAWCDVHVPYQIREAAAKAEKGEKDDT